MGAHEDLDAEAAAIRASVRQGLFGDDAPMRIGRFEVVSTLGRGGMGIVYEAHDAGLDRRVAVKLLRAPALGPDSDPARAERLLREAQAIAKLSHPNVVSVYEVGSIGDSVFMAMELVAGQTLRAWLEAQARSWRAVIDVVAQAGRGVAAAHAVGLVHRDLKPDNVMIDPEGRARVLDFGLARLAGLDISIDDDTLEQPESSPDMLTVTGMVLGTPAYMAPEQRRSRTAVPASDQYSLCVTLHEALTGERPERSEDPDVAVALGSIPGPGALRRILRRGLSVDPRDRFASMAALVDALERAAAPRRWRWVVGAAGLGAAVATGFVSLAGSAETDCATGVEQAAAVWNPTRREAIANNFDRAATAFAQDAWPRVQAEIDGRIATWIAADATSCAETREHATQSEEVRLWRSLCMTSQLQRLDALLEALTAAEPIALAQTTAALATLDDVTQCDAGHASRNHAQWPTDPAVVEALPGVELKLAVAAAARDEGKLEAAFAASEEAVTLAEATGFAPTIAKALRQHALMQSALGHPQDAEATLRAAIETAEAGHDDDTAASAWIALVHTVGEELARLDDAERMFALCRGAIARAGDPEHLRWRYLVTKASVLDAAGDFDAAIADFEEATVIVAALHGPNHPSLAGVYHGHARALLNRGDARAALAVARRGLAVSEASFGARHPDVATLLTTIGNAHGSLGEHDAAVSAMQRAIRIVRDALGDSHPRLGALHNNLAGLFMMTRQPDQALPHYERAVAIDLEALGPDHPHRTPAMYGLAMVHLSRGEYDTAETLFVDGLEIVERAWGKAHPDTAYLITALGDLYLQRGEPQSALAEYERVLALLTSSLGVDHPRLVASHLGAGRALRALGRGDESRVALQAAVTIVDGGRCPPLEAAGARFELAKALADDASARARARTLAEQARDTFADSGPSLAEQTQEVVDFLAALP